jgi:SOS-response transcriptional repressor LexA
MKNFQNLNNDDELTLKQASVELDCSKPTLGAAIAEGTLKGRRVGGDDKGGFWLVKVGDLKTWHAGRRKPGRRPAPKTYAVPFAGVVGAGPGKLDEFPEGTTTPVPTQQPDGVVAYLVSGDSMADSEAGIQDGDVILVRVRPEAEHGKNVIAWVDELGGMVFKRFNEQGNGVRYLSSRKFHHVLTERDRVYGVFVEKIPRTPPAE